MVTTPKPRIEPLTYTVTCLPAGHPLIPYLSIYIDVCPDGRWKVHDGWTPATIYDADGQVDHDYRFTNFTTTVETASRIAETMSFQGQTIAEILASDETKPD